MEQEVKDKVPEIYGSIVKLLEDEIDWEEVHEDLSELSWLDPAENNFISILENTWKILDRWAVSVVDGRPRAKIFKLNHVKASVINCLYSLSLQNDKTDSIISSCRSELHSLQFFAQAKNLVKASLNHNEFAGIVESVSKTYKELKKTLVALMIHIEKVILADLKQTVSELLDDLFRTHIVQPFRKKILEDYFIKYLVDEFDRETEVSLDNFEGNIYFGEVDEFGRRTGYGRITYSNGDQYEGFWEDDKPHGKGLYFWNGYGSYEGDFEEGKITGKGKRIYPSGNEYEGEFVDSMKQGLGTMRFKQGDVYDGEWHQDSMSGMGRYTWSTSDCFEGKFKNDKRHGKGTLTLASGEQIEAEWKDNEILEGNHINSENS